MVKIVGKLILIFCMLSSPCAQAQLTLSITSMQGEPLEQAGIGQPFLVIVEGESVPSATPFIEGLEQFVTKQSGVQMRIVNGITQVKYQYEVRSDKTGHFTIGPAVCKAGSKEYRSHAVSITVGHESVLSNATQHKAKEAVLLRVTVDKNSVVVGEKIKGTVRFYIASKTIQLHEIHAPRFEEIGLKVLNPQGPEQGVEQIQGTTYSYAQWEWEAYPTRTGTFVIPAYWAEYSVMPSFWSQRVGKRVYSNALTITVQELPDAPGAAHAVGHYTHFHASIKPNVSKQGEAMVLTLELVGDGDMAAISYPVLRNIPETVRVYESKQMVVEPTFRSEQRKKRFEYIVQALKPGDFQIPPQQFTFFDTVQRSYHSLTTEPLFITVLAESAVSPHALSHANDSGEMAVVDEPLSHSDNDTISLITQGPWFPVSSYAIAWPLFLLLGSIPLLACALFVVVVPLYRRYIQQPWYASRWYRKRLAYKKIAHAQKTQDYKALYALFIELLAFYQPASATYDTHAGIEQAGERFKDTVTYKEKWEQFIDRLMQAAFYDHANAQLFQEAKEWVRILQDQL
jgi:hypothetical protein